MRLYQAARSVFLTEFVQAFFLSMQYSFTPPNGCQLAAEEVASCLWILPAVPRS